MKAQTRLMSFIEAWSNVAVGFVINLFANLLILPLFGLQVTLSDALGIGLVFTIISVIRSYLLRRFYERLRLRG
jgi:hypothetical protein